MENNKTSFDNKRHPFEDDVPTAPLVSILYREHAKHINELVKKDNLSFGLHPLLVTIYFNEGISQEELANVFHLNESTVTRNLKKLDDKGFIERIPDKRRKRIKVTEKGKKATLNIMDYDEKWDERIKSLLSDDEYDVFLSILKKICAGLI